MQDSSRSGSVPFRGVQDELQHRAGTARGELLLVLLHTDAALLGDRCCIDAVGCVGLAVGSREDARKGRIYLPVNELQQFNVTAADLLNARETENFSKLMAFQVARAQQAYDEAFALLPKEDRRAQRPGLIMAAIYRTLLNEIEEDGYHVLKQRISLTPIRKLWLAWKTWVRG